MTRLTVGAALVAAGPSPNPLERKKLQSQDFRAPQSSSTYIASNKFGPKLFQKSVYVDGQEYITLAKYTNDIDGFMPRAFTDQTKMYYIGYKIDNSVECFKSQHATANQDVVKIPVEKASQYGYVDKAWIASPVIFAGCLAVGVTAVALGAIFFNPAVIAIGSVLIVASLIAPFAAVIGAKVYKERKIEHHDKYHQFEPVYATKIQKTVNDKLIGYWVAEDSLVGDDSEESGYKVCKDCDAVNHIPK